MAAPSPFPVRPRGSTPASWLPIVVLALAPAVPSLAQSARVVLEPAPGYTLAWDGNNGGYSSLEPGALAPENDALAGTGTAAFASSSFQPGGIHDFPNVNDGYYGNSSSWIADFTADPPDLQPFIGLAFHRTVAIASIAWGRDNGDGSEPSCGGTCTDRAIGLYTLQFTRVTLPDEFTPDTGNAATGWETLGTVEYLPGPDTPAFSAYLRHRFDVAQDGAPIPATGLRILVPNTGTAIDEIEVNPPADPVPPLSSFITWTNAPGFTISWDLNDGALYDPSSPAPAPLNDASPSRGTVAFGSSELGLGTHLIAHVNDGLYGNARSWIPDAADAAPFIGLDFGRLVPIRHVAWSRDNGDDGDCCGGELTDRALGIYTLQVTRVANPAAATAETGDPATGWAEVGSIHYRAPGPVFTPHRRHRFDLSTASGLPIPATGLRIKVSNPGTAIDEIEVNTYPALERDLSGNLEILAESGYSITWDGNDGEFHSPEAGARSPAHDGLASNGGRAFGSSELGFGIHFIAKINDGLYGNSSSWISANGLGGFDDPDPFVGIAFPEILDISTVAWGRDNGDVTEGGCGGTCLDRSIGLYTLQITRVPDPGLDTPETGAADSGWETVGTVEYLEAAAPAFNPSLRHAFNLSRDGQPIPATGFRIKVSDGSIAIDELEINPRSGIVVPPLSDLLVLEPAPGFGIAWDRNEGEFSTPDSPAPARDNAALASRGATAFGSGELDLGVHFIRNVNDGLYGNTQSWIPAPSSSPFIGIRLPAPAWIRSVAWGRDNGDATDCCGGTLTDRALGLYTLQITRVSTPGSDTPETGDPSTGWVTVATLDYKAAAPNVFTPHLRHRYEVTERDAPILATGLRLKVPNDQTAIDELEINPRPSPDQNVLLLAPHEGFTLDWDGNNGDYGTPDSPAPAPDNAALAARGATAFGSSEADLGTHLIAKVNDGFYGNHSSWIADFINGDPEPWIGVRFASSVAVSSVAWGRDNGDVAGDCCGGTLTDRAAGTYHLDYTQVPDPTADLVLTEDPASGWAGIGRIEYRGAGTPAFRHHLRHEFEVALDGAPIQATAIRLRVPHNGIAVDELEVNPVPALPPPDERPTLTVARGAEGITLAWPGGGTLQSAETIPVGPWTNLEGASPITLPFSGAARYFRVRR
ncbi:MAG: hypothetical protein KF833_18725 [Verrucomicrobiae bacterium]|nr:hypothetical protein [Verrucomicrobiae bacterium]